MLLFAVLGAAAQSSGNWDVTSTVSSESEAWTDPQESNNHANITQNNITMTERWFNRIPTGEIMSQTVTLPNGTYEAQVYCHGHVAWVSSLASDGATGYTTLSANGVVADIPVIHNTGWNSNEPTLYTLKNIPVTDGKLTFSVTAKRAGANWFTICVKSLVCKKTELYYTIGDVNDDDVVSISDVTSLVNIILGKQKNYRQELADVNEEGGVNISDVTALVNIILGKQETKTVDKTSTYANATAMIYAGQSATENAAGPEYILQSAKTLLGGGDASARYDIGQHVTTLRISTTLPNVASVSVYALDKTAIAGPMTMQQRGDDISYAYTNGDEQTYANGLQSDVVTVTGTATTYVAYLRPVPLAKGVKVTVRTTDGKFYSQDFTSLSVGKTNDLTFTQTTAANLWMATIPGNTYFSMLSTPGAHDAATSGVSGLFASYAKCQSQDIAGLLASGVRAFDLRPRYTSSSANDIKLDNLEIYHGIIATGVKFKDAIDVLINFVKNNPSEAVSVLMQKESSSGSDQSETWRASIRECFSDANRSPYLMGSVRGYHTLDDVRGKVSIVSKNPYGNSSNSYRDVIYGAVVENWPDDGVVADYSCAMTQAWNWVDCRASVEDAYNSNTDTKKSQVQTQLNLASDNTDHFRYNYTFTSIANSITSNAKTMNDYTANTLIPKLNGPLCYVYGDFMGDGSYNGSVLVKAIVEQNYKYVFKERSR